MAGRAQLSGAAGVPDVPRPPRPRWRAALGRLLRAASAALRGARWGRAAALGAVAVLLALTVGVTTASTDQSLGPHVARYAVTTDDVLTLDLGPLGTVQIDSPLPLTLGVRVTVQEIPATVTAVDPARTVQMLGQDLESYVQFFTGPQATLEDAARALVVDALRRSAVVLAVLVGLALVVRALIGPARRRQLAVAWRPHRADAARAAVVVVVVAVTCVSSLDEAGRPAPARAAAPVFDGTPLEGARITGRLAGVVNTYGSVVVDAYRGNERFYDAVQGEVAAAWDQRAQALQARARSSGAATIGPARDLSTPTPSPTPAAEPVVIVLVSDLHCNVGMARVIRTVAERSEADLVLNAGDTTVNGTSVEKYCVTEFSDAVPDGVPRVVADGNHDSLETADHERAAGWTVLDGEVVEAAGVRILGDRDPNQTQIGRGTAQVSDESAADAGERLAEAACAAGDVDILLIHTPRVGDAAMRSGCVPVQLSGHQHRRSGPLQVGQGVRYVSSTTAGATSGGATIGPLNGVAEITVLRFDPEERRMLDLQVVQMSPDGSVTVGVREPWPQPVPTDVDGDGVVDAPVDGGTGDGVEADGTGGTGTGRTGTARTGTGGTGPGATGGAGSGTGEAEPEGTGAGETEPEGTGAGGTGGEVDPGLGPAGEAGESPDAAGG